MIISEWESSAGGVYPRPVISRRSPITHFSPERVEKIIPPRDLSIIFWMPPSAECNTHTTAPSTPPQTEPNHHTRVFIFLLFYLSNTLPKTKMLLFPVRRIHNSYLLNSVAYNVALLLVLTKNHIHLFIASTIHWSNVLWPHHERYGKLSAKFMELGDILTFEWQLLSIKNYP